MLFILQFYSFALDLYKLEGVVKDEEAVGRYISNVYLYLQTSGLTS